MRGVAVLTEMSTKVASQRVVLDEGCGSRNRNVPQSGITKGGP